MGVSPRSMEDIFGKISEAAGPRPGSTSVPRVGVNTPGRVQKVKAARAAAPVLGLKEALDVVDALAKFNTVTGPVLLSDDENRAVEAALRKNTGYAFDVQRRAVVEAINNVRAGDPEGVVRKSDAGEYAFSVGGGTYLLIQGGANPRYRTASSAEAKDIKQGWEIAS